MTLKESIKKFWAFLKKDTWQSWLVSLILIVILIKFIFFPLLSFLTGSPLPLVVVESCSMYHEASFDSWWQSNEAWYKSKNVTLSNFESYPLKNGLNKGDIIFVLGQKAYKKGDIIIFNSQTTNPIIHRLISVSPYATKGDHNSDQLPIEKEISPNQIIGKGVFKIPLLGWIKLIFFEPFRDSGRGFCK